MVGSLATESGGGFSGTNAWLCSPAQHGRAPKHLDCLWGSPWMITQAASVKVFTRSLLKPCDFFFFKKLGQNTLSH